MQSFSFTAHQDRASAQEAMSPKIAPHPTLTGTFPLILMVALTCLLLALQANGELDPLVCPVGGGNITREQLCNETVFCPNGEDNRSTYLGEPCFLVVQCDEDDFVLKLYLFNCDCEPPVAVALDMVCDSFVDCPNGTDETFSFCAGRENCEGYCLNGGTCVAGGTCVCTEDWAGERCADPSCSPACENGGTCIAVNECSCTSGWSGAGCTEPVCDPPCVNGGLCIDLGIFGHKCACFYNWIGPDCSTPVCSVPCANGGTCSAPDTCTCPDGFTGDTCDSTGGGMGGDPHFSVTLSDGSSFCYSIQGLAGFPFSLVSSQHFVMNAVFVKPPLKLKQYSTLLGEIGVLYRANRSTIRMRFDSHEKVIELSGYGTLDVTRVCAVTVTKNEMSVRSLDKALNWASNVSVSIKDVGLNFVVFFHNGHLDLVWSEVKHCKYPAHGLVGQFLNRNVRVNKLARALIIPNRPSVPVAMDNIWPEVHQKGRKCWKARNPGYQGEGLIQGEFLDYIVDHIFATDFIFSLSKGPR